MLITKSNSWIIAVSSCIIYFLVFGASRVAPLLYAESIHRYKVDRSAASFPFVLNFVTRFLFGPLVGCLGKQFGVRCITFIGCLLSAIGTGACFFAEDIVTVTVFWGIIYGFGSGAGCLLVPNILNLVFHHNKSMANGVVLGGASLGALVIPGLVIIMLEAFGLLGTFLLISAMVLHSVPASMLLKINDSSKSEVNGSLRCKSNDQNYFKRSIKTSRKLGNASKYNKTKSRSLETVRCFCNETHMQPLMKLDDVAQNSIIKSGIVCVNDSTNLSEELSPLFDLDKNTLTNSFQSKMQDIPKDPPFPSIQEHPTTNKSNPDFTETATKEVLNHPMTSTKSPEKNISAFKSWHIFVDLKFLVISLYHSAYFFVAITILTIFIDFLRDKGVDTSEEVYFLAGLIVSDLLGRLSLGWVTDRGYLSLTQYLVIGFFLTGVMLVVCPWISIFVVLICVLFSIAFLMGALIVVFPNTIEEFIEPEFRIMGMSSRFFLCAPLSLIISPMIGYFRETLGSYDWIFYILGASSFLSCFLAAIPSRLLK